MPPIDLHIEQDVIDELQTTPECAALFERVLGHDPQAVLLTDLSCLSDFAGSGIGAPKPDGLTYHQYLDAWDAWVLARIRSEFGVELDKPSIRLTELIPKLRPTTRHVH